MAEDTEAICKAEMACLFPRRGKKSHFLLCNDKIDFHWGRRCLKGCSWFQEMQSSRQMLPRNVPINFDRAGYYSELLCVSQTSLSRTQGARLYSVSDCSRFNSGVYVYVSVVERKIIIANSVNSGQRLMGKGKIGSMGKRPWSRVIGEGQNETEHIWEGHRRRAVFTLVDRN